MAIDGLLAPGHVSTVIGWGAYTGFVARHRVPCVVAGFEPHEMLRAILALVRQLAEGRSEVENEYAAVTKAGNRKALAALAEVFEPCDSEWRGLGGIPAGGMALRAEHARRRPDALRSDGGAGARGPALPLRRGAARGDTPTGVPGLRPCLHARAPTGPVHGLL